MPISDYLNNISNTIRASLIVLACVLGLVWLNQQSLEQYWALHFHRESLWSTFSSPHWKMGSKLMHAAEAAKETFEVQISDSLDLPADDTLHPIFSVAGNEPITPAQVGVAIEHTKEVRQLDRGIVAQRQSDNNPKGREQLHTILTSCYDKQGNVILPAGKKVLFIGDSMMEGVAPHVLLHLKDSFQTEGINLSKRSTGLAYPGFFNWPETTARALENDANIGLLTVFLGPNDPWDMPVSKGQPYLRFSSEEWQGEYRRRIRQILTLTQEYNIPVIWILPPNMRKEKLNRGMAVLDNLYELEVKNVGGTILRVNDIFGYQRDNYSPMASINNKKIHVRAGDGIHFTPSGAEIIAKAIMGKIHYIAPEGMITHDK